MTPFPPFFLFICTSHLFSWFFFNTSILSNTSCISCHYILSGGLASITTECSYYQLIYSNTMDNEFLRGTPDGSSSSPSTKPYSAAFTYETKNTHNHSDQNRSVFWSYKVVWSWHALVFKIWCFQLFPFTGKMVRLRRYTRLVVEDWWIQS